MSATRSPDNRYNAGMTQRAVSILAGVLVAAAAPALGQQNEPKKNPPQSNIITLNGCVLNDRTQHNVYTLTEENDPTIYRLTGTNVKQYVGQRVEISAVMSKRPVIVGGLYPTPNVAAQAGAIDPGKAAVEQMIAGSNPAGRPTLDLRVKSVRPVPGACPDAK
jgi:hypothetical protein